MLRIASGCRPSAWPALCLLFFHARILRVDQILSNRIILGLTNNRAVDMIVSVVVAAAAKKNPEPLAGDSGREPKTGEPESSPTARF